MDYDDIDKILGNPIQSLEIDVKQPTYQLDSLDLGVPEISDNSLDISFGSSRTSINVTHHKAWSNRK
jgi:hypothetical protein